MTASYRSLLASAARVNDPSQYFKSLSSDVTNFTALIQALQTRLDVTASSFMALSIEGQAIFQGASDLEKGGGNATFKALLVNVDAACTTLTPFLDIMIGGLDKLPPLMDGLHKAVSETYKDLQAIFRISKTISGLCRTVEGELVGADKLQSLCVRINANVAPFAHVLSSLGFQPDRIPSPAPASGTPANPANPAKPTTPVPTPNKPANPTPAPAPAPAPNPKPAPTQKLPAPAPARSPPAPTPNTNTNTTTNTTANTNLNTLKTALPALQAAAPDVLTSLIQSATSYLTTTLLGPLTVLLDKHFKFDAPAGTQAEIDALKKGMAVPGLGQHLVSLEKAVTGLGGVVDFRVSVGGGGGDMKILSSGAGTGAGAGSPARLRLNEVAERVVREISNEIKGFIQKGTFAAVA